VNITGNTAAAWGLIAASAQSGLPLFLGTYPITPASDILHELSKHKQFGVRTFQAEDEIAGVGAALGAAFGGSLGVTTTSGPGVDLKAETVGLAISLELPLVIIDIQRGGPSTGLPTKTEQADLLHAMYGRHGEAPLPIVAAMTPSHCFAATIEAVRLAVKYRTPVMLLSDGYLANGTEPWRLPDLEDLPEIDPGFATAPNHTGPDGEEAFWPYIRDDETLARPWAPPVSPGSSTGSAVWRRPTAAATWPTTGPTRTDEPPARGPDRRHCQRHSAARGRRRRCRCQGARGRLGVDLRSHRRRGQADQGPGPEGGPRPSRPPQPIPVEPGGGARRLRQGPGAEVNLGQLNKLLRAEFLVDVVSFTKLQGLPFRAAEIEAAILQQIGDISTMSNRPTSSRVGCQWVRPSGREMER